MSSVVATTSEDGGTFHDADCHFAGTARPENRVTLDSPDAAEEEGYRPCTFCFPERREAWLDELRQSMNGSGARGGSSNGSGAPDDASWEGDRHPRGVFQPQFTGPGGEDVFVAVDSFGRCMAWVNVPEAADRRAVSRAFRHLLSVLDTGGWKEQREAAERRGELKLIH